MDRALGRPLRRGAARGRGPLAVDHADHAGAARPGRDPRGGLRARSVRLAPARARLASGWRGLESRGAFGMPPRGGGAAPGEGAPGAPGGAPVAFGAQLPWGPPAPRARAPA